jgi:eukaryotic-like serine/threonine-protein kinase
MPADATQTLPMDRQSSPERPLLGKVVDQRYRVLEHIGSGGMADVYEVEHVSLGRRLAMKVLRQTRASNPQLSRRFSREARAASRLESEHVVSIHDYGILPEGFPYFVMELLHGQNLRGLLRAEQRLPVARAVNIAIDVCLGLHAAHSAGLVHRDLKPENLWLSRGDDGRELCVLLDFGVAHFDGAHTTGDGVLVGTARYMSPEQIGSEDALGPESDLFSLGVLLYECLTGVPPFNADSLERTLFRILNETVKPAGALCEAIPAELSSVLERVMSKRPEQRYPSALDLAAHLRPFAGVMRPLPSLDLASGHGLTDQTLAEEPLVSATPYGEVVPDGGPKPERRSALLSFGAGLLLGGGALLWLRPAPKQPAVIATPSTAAAVAVPTPPVSPPSRPSAAAAPTATEAEAPASSARSVGPALLRKPSMPAPTTSTSVSRPSRPEPPRTSFDGTNPYLQ